MSNEISKFYQFLADQGSNWTKLADSASYGGNEDGTVIKAEFKDFIKTEWNGEEMGLELTNDLINQFWAKIDTNRSTTVIKGTDNLKNYNALDNKEIENIEARIVAYQQFNEYSDEYIKSPGVFTSSDAAWKNDVETELMTHLEEWINNGCQGDLTEYLEQFRPAIEAKYTAEYCAAEYQNELVNTILKDYSEYRILDDETLGSLLDAYLENISSSGELPAADTIKNEVRAIIDAYFATAGLSEGSDYDLSTLGYAPNADSGLNDIQKEVLTAQLMNNLSEITSSASYKENQALYDKAINNYISGIISSTTFGDFNTVMNKGVEEFKATEDYKNLMTQIEAVNALTLEDNSTLYNAIASQLGDTIAEALATNIKFGKAKELFDQIINQALEKVANGDFALDISNQLTSDDLASSLSTVGSGMKDSNKVLSAPDSSAIDFSGSRLPNLDSLATGDYIDINALINWVVEQLALNLGEIMPNGYNDMPIENLNELYKNQYDLAMDLADDDSDNAAQMIKDAAINYCKALADKGDSYLSAIKSVFGSLDYESVISELINDGDIFSVNSAIEEIMSKVLDIKESANVDDLEMNWSKDLGDFEMNTGCTRSFTIGDVRSSNNVDIDTSLIKYSATVTSGDATATVDGLGNITITSSDSVGVSSIEISVMYDGKVIGTKKINVTVAKNELSTGNSIFEELGYTEDNSGYLRTNKTDGLDLDNAKSQACGLVETEVQNIAKALEAAGYSSTLLAKAKDMTVAYFNAYINAVYADGVAEQKKRPNVTFEANGESYTQEFFYRSRIPDTGLGYRPDEADVQLTQQTCWGKRGMWISVSKNAIIEKFIEYYNQLI